MMSKPNEAGYLFDCYVVDTSRYGSILWLLNEDESVIELLAPSDMRLGTRVYVDDSCVGSLPEEPSRLINAFMAQGYARAFDAEVVQFDPSAPPGKQLLLRIGVRELSNDVLSAPTSSATADASASVYDEDIPY